MESSKYRRCKKSCRDSETEVSTDRKAHIHYVLGVSAEISGGF